MKWANMLESGKNVIYKLGEQYKKMHRDKRECIFKAFKDQKPKYEGKHQ